MKKIWIVLVAMVGFGLSKANAQTTGSTSLQGEGIMVLKALASVDSYNQFATYFVTAGDYRALARQLTDRSAADQLYEFAEGIEQGTVIENRVWRVWYLMMEAGRPYRVDWSKVEYVDWKYKAKTKMGINGGVGTLVFRSNGKLFIVSPVMLKVGDTYKIASWGNVASKVMTGVLSENLTTTYQNGQYCVSDGSNRDCINIAQELNEMDF
jgi:hypothetical protein